MKLTTVKIMKRKNLGNYEHEEITLEAVLSEGEDAAGAIIGLKDLVHAALNADDMQLSKMAEQVLSNTSTDKGLTVEKVTLKPLAEEPAATANFVKEAPVKEKAAPRSRKPAKETASDTLEGQAIPPVIPQEAAPSENTGTTQPVVGATVTESKPAVESKESVASPPVIGKGIVAYDSKIKEHRSRFATFLGQTYPKWKPDAQFGVNDSPEKAAYSEKVRVFSANLHGKAFEDAKGNMLDSFKAELESFFSHAK